MKPTAVVTTRLDADLAARLDTLAGHLDRSRAWVIQQAVGRYVDEESAFILFIREGEASADRGELIGQDEMEAWFEARHTLPAAAE